uniref:NHS-like protein 3 isoform X3 n=1 Tax=Monopterus albus TaxID=43700 RepID=UPI0009B416D5|nr:uncharacterized protein KIAA1522 homolog isoform X3 [Monopterus albus]
MGNSIQKEKKKVQTKKNFSAPSSPFVSPNQDRPKGYWLFGHPDKLKTVGPRGNEDQKRLTVHYTTSQHYQDNVFIEGNRPQYLEDLHTEAQEGLKILQQEEHMNGVNFPDDESITSTDTLRPDQDISSKDRGGSPSRSIDGNTDTTVTSVLSTRPVITRQGSTFKPLNPVKRLEKGKKRSRRTTIMGIPNHVQKELVVHRSSTFQPLVTTQLSNHDEQVSDSQSGVVIILTVDGGTPVANKEGARVHLSELELESGDEQLLWKKLQAVYQDEPSFNHQGSGAHLCSTSTLRPKSVAVPGMTASSSFCPTTVLSFFQEPQGPVMSISPQATYLSTIIPNAVLPASVEVIEINRSSSHIHCSSVRPVSKSSLASGDSSVDSLLVRRSDGDSSQSDHLQNNPTPMSTSASGSNWGESQSSKTLVSNSPISSKGSICSQRVGLDGDQDLVSLDSSVSMISSPSSKSKNVVTGPGSESGVSGSVTAGEEAKDRRNFTRNLSIMKTKQPPAPPRRTNSLHSNNIRSNSRVLLDCNDFVSRQAATAIENIVGKDEINMAATDISLLLISGSNTAVSSSADASSSLVSPTQASSVMAGGKTQPQPESSNSSPQKTPSDRGKFERTMSPSSGYSSQSGTPTLSPKEISPPSPNKQRKKPAKPERSMSRASSTAASPSSSLTSLSSGTSEYVSTDISTHSTSLPLQESPTDTVAKEFTTNYFTTLREEFKELMDIPPPPKVKAPCPPPPETWVHNRHTFELLCGTCPNIGRVNQKPAQTEGSTVKQKGTGTQTEVSKEMQVLVEKQTPRENSPLELSESKAKPETSLATGLEGVHKELEGRECPHTQQERVETSADLQGQEQKCTHVVKDLVNPERTPKKDRPPVMKKPITVLHREELVSTQGSVETSCAATIEVHLPVDNNTTSSENEVTLLDDKSEVTSMQRVQEEMHVVESCWPPPPPPLEGDSVFDGGDEIDFPPPPPFVADGVLDVMDSFMTKLDVLKRPTEDEQIVVDSSEAGASVHGQIPDLPPAVPQSSVNANKPEGVLQVLNANITDEISCQPLQNVSDSIPPPPVEAPPLPPITRAENPVIISALVPSHGFLRRGSLKTEDQTPSKLPISTQLEAPIILPVAPSLSADNLTHGVHFRRQPSEANRDARSKELQSRHKSALIPKEDAHIPLVTPSLLQMVRLKSVNMTDDQVKALSEDKPTNEGAPVQENCPVSIPGPQNIPQKPIRKSLSLKSPPQTVKTSSVTLNTPSMRLQEAIRMKTAAMSSRDNLPSRLGVRSPIYSIEPGAVSLKSPEGHDMHKSPASTASFIFSRSTKKVVIETASSLDAQASLTQSLATELMQVSDQSRGAAFSNSGVKCNKIPPPVAKKPSHSSISPSQNHPANPGKMELSLEGSGVTGRVQHLSGITPPDTTTRVTTDTIETLF